MKWALSPARRLAVAPQRRRQVGDQVVENGRQVHVDRFRVFADDGLPNGRHRLLDARRRVVLVAVPVGFHTFFRYSVFFIEN